MALFLARKKTLNRNNGLGILMSFHYDAHSKAFMRTPFVADSLKLGA